MNVLILSSACCYPGLAVYDEQAKKVAEQAAGETGVKTEIRTIPAASAIYSGAIPKDTVTILMKKFSQNEPGPAILINGEIISYGVPKLEDMKAALKKFEESGQSGK